MKRDKLISLRQNSELLNQVQKIIDKHTEVSEYSGRKFYYCDLTVRGWISNKYTISDIFEEALIRFVAEHKRDLNV